MVWTKAKWGVVMNCQAGGKTWNVSKKMVVFYLLMIANISSKILIYELGNEKLNYFISKCTSEELMSSWIGCRHHNLSLWVLRFPFSIQLYHETLLPIQFVLWRKAESHTCRDNVSRVRFPWQNFINRLWTLKHRHC